MDFTYIAATKAEGYDNVQITTKGVVGQFVHVSRKLLI